MLSSITASTVLSGVGLSLSIKYASTFFKNKVQIYNILLACFVVAGSMQGLWFYFKTYDVKAYFEDPTNTFSYESSRWLQGIKKDTLFFLLSTPDVPYLSFASYDYFAPNIQKQYLNNTNAESLNQIPFGRDLLFVATPDREADMEFVRSLIPGGDWVIVNQRKYPDRVLFYSYFVESGVFKGLP
jgi:hypothetical protein